MYFGSVLYGDYDIIKVIGGDIMKQELFIRKIIDLRKKKKMTQQDLADQLHVSNKTISRYETGEGLPDIETLKMMADIFGVSTDYLLSDQEDFKDLNKMDVVSYIPLIVGVLAILIYFLFIKLSIPSIIAFMVYFYIERFSFQFLNLYTDKKNGRLLLDLNTVSYFFVVQNLVISILTIVQLCLVGYFPFIGGNMDMDINTYSFIGWWVLSLIVAVVFAYLHYRKYPEYQARNRNK